MQLHLRNFTQANKKLDRIWPTDRSLDTSELLDRKDEKESHVNDNDNNGEDPFNSRTCRMKILGPVHTIPDSSHIGLLPISDRPSIHPHYT